MENNSPKILTCIKDYNQDRASYHVDFGVQDERGRAMGARIDTGTHEYVVDQRDPATTWNGCTHPVGTYLWFSPQATRNGKKYGALQGDVHFATEDERQAAIQRYLADAKKRAAKRAATVAARKAVV